MAFEYIAEEIKKDLVEKGHSVDIDEKNHRVRVDNKYEISYTNFYYFDIENPTKSIGRGRLDFYKLVDNSNGYDI